MKNVLLIWVDSNINENNTDCSNTIKQFKRVVNNVHAFTDSEECVEFVQTITNNKVCMIISGSLGKHIVPHVHNMSQVDTIFIFCSNKEWHKEWTKEWLKIKGIFTDITSICETLKQAAHKGDENAIPISFMASNKKVDQLDPSFMYTQILKEILLTIDFEEKHFKEFIAYCRDKYNDDENELKNVLQLQKTYKNKIPIWWYTWDAFLYPMLNQALRLMDADIIIRMGFFINDLQRDIQRLHSKQFNNDQLGTTFTVYRGQGLSQKDFTEMTNTKGGLLSFDNFLSTSRNRSVSLSFAQQAATNPDLVGILFVMSINPAHSTTPFASVSDVSYFHKEDEVLFSMHTIFRIGDIKPLNGNNHLYKVNLALTSDNDQELRTLTDRIRQETFPDSRGWFRLGLLLIKMGQFNKAQEVCEVLLDQATHESGKAPIYYQLGQIKYNQGEYQEALSFHEKALTIRQQLLPFNHPDLGDSYNRIGSVYYSMGDYPKALSYYEKSLTIRQQSFASNHPNLGASYNNIGLVYYKMGDNPKALSSYEKTLAIQQQSLPANHPDLGVSYVNIGGLYYSMKDYPKALSYYEKALALKQQSLPANHPDVALSYVGIGNVYYSMSDYSKALLSYEKALIIRQHSLSPNHPDLAMSYNNIGSVYYIMGDYSKALSYYEKDLIIRQKSLTSNHPDLGASYSHIGRMHEKLNKHSKAQSFYERAIQIGQQSLSTNDPRLQKWTTNLERMKKNL
ncbi:unnamed protein product [Adineta steineri]|uniref:ADP ribosyltransferase domain-containing protein n=2 Tax=Adineta steineri TaxID=433720 RepID=A0A814T072_9BILA|nr:unnamed protein product [Adineta steineri]CAF3719398.1 unnamed protein product [Adineta steineri]